MQNYLLTMVEKRKNGIHCGVPSFCCANKIVIEAILEQAKRFDDVVLIEGTANQVNQFGGYTGMTPKTFKEFVFSIADKIKFDHNKIILGGDHMGPLPWSDLNAKEAMENAKNLVSQCVLAGYKKIHLDTSMLLGDDPRNEKLSNEVIAERGVELYKACEDAYKILYQNDKTAIKPVFVIGSEVPVPGGVFSTEDKMIITSVTDFEDTLLAYKKKFIENGLNHAWKDIIALVVQPGVEFGVDKIVDYDRIKAYKLCQALKHYPDIVFEGHSTDFQSPKKLREMVEDGIAIIKVGPALTLAVREGLTALDIIEKQLIKSDSEQAHFVEVLDNIMEKNPKQWRSYYTGESMDVKLERLYSFSDRCRYYLSYPEVEAAIEKLFNNLDSLEIPLSMIHQYMPLQYKKIKEGKLRPKAKELVKAAVVNIVEDYNYAVKYNYMINGVFAS